MAVQSRDNPSGGSKSESLSVAIPVLVPMGKHQGKPPIILNRPVFVIGSHSRARIHLISESVSKHHALLAQTRHHTYIRDLASRTHTFVNDVQVRERVLVDGDVIK